MSKEVNIYTYTGTYTFSFLLSACLGVELLSHQVDFSCNRYSQTVFQGAFPSLHCHPQYVRGYVFILPQNALKLNISQISISVSSSSK